MCQDTGWAFLSGMVHSCPDVLRQKGEGVDGVGWGVAEQHPDSPESRVATAGPLNNIVIL